MRMGRIKVCGVEYPACLSTRVILNIKDRTGKEFDTGINELLGNGDLGGLFWLMAQMLKAGKKYMELTGETTPEPPSEEDLVDLVGIDEYAGLVKVITDTASGTGTPDVILEDDGKNLKTTEPTA